MISLTELNDEQRSAAQHIQGPLLILAGAGSGKTRTIVYRMANMVHNHQIDAKSILGITFTNKASREMRDRVKGLAGSKYARKMTLCTFHALGVRILREDIEKLGYHKNFSIYDTSDQMSIMREALKNFKGDKKFDRKAILGKIGFLKNNGIKADDFADSQFYDPDDTLDFVTEYAYRFYEEKLKFYNVIDFDDILQLTVRLLKERPDIAKKYSTRFQYILVDEYQDTNPLQFELLEALTSTHNNLCAVGDDDQSIYSFRGADITNILSFEKHYAGAKLIKLEQNYRSTTAILDLANKVIAENKNRKEKALWSENKSDVLPLLWATGDTDHEAAIVVDEIAKYQTAGNHLGDVAILYRSNTQIPPFEEELRISGIPYKILGGQKFYEKKEIKDLIAFLSCIHNSKDELSLRRILNIPHRGIGQVTLDLFLNYAKENTVSLFESLQLNTIDNVKRQDAIIHFTSLVVEARSKFESMELDKAIEWLIEELDFINWIDGQYESKKIFERKKADVLQFIESSRRFMKFHPNNATLQNFLEKVLLQDSQDKEENDDDDVRANEVTLMTLHSSKGLEFDIVYLVGAEEEFLPHKRTIIEGDDISEERRLAYVGITRAREKLIITYCKQRRLYGKDVPRKISRFIVSFLDKVERQDRTKFDHMSEEETKDYKKSFFQNILEGLD